MNLTLTLSPLQLDVLWESRQAGEAPYPLLVPPQGTTESERRRLCRQAHEELRDRGLLEADGRLDPELDAVLAALADARRSVDSVFVPAVGAELVRAVAAAGRGRGVLAVQDGAGVTLRRVEHTGLASAVVDLLPPAPRGTERALTMPAAEFAGADARLVGLPSLRAGQLAANSRDALGGRRRSPVLVWFDNETGRYFGHTRKARDGHEWTTVAPADAATLRVRLSEMMAAVTDDDR
ncbi:MAG: ESX secretion-associated protein EspG [Labedaea sp.]